MIKEVIIVEGKDDISAIKRAVDAEVIKTSGYHISSDTMDRIRTAYEKRGIIIFTDPDHAGEAIRKRLTKLFKNSKQAFLPIDKALKGDNIGIENSKPEDIREALEKSRVEKSDSKEIFTKYDLIRLGLIGMDSSSEKRKQLGKILGIGYCNSKQLLKRLNNYGISLEEFKEAIKEIENGR